MCAYCRESFKKGQLTKDHVPPQGVLGKEWRKGLQLPWVDCCRDCHQGTSDDDDALKKLIGFGAVRNHEAANVMAEALRSINVPSPVLKEMKAALEASQEPDFYLDGLPVAHSYRMPDLMAEHVNRSIRRTAIGLVFKQHPEVDTRNYDFKVR